MKRLSYVFNEEFLIHLSAEQSKSTSLTKGVSYFEFFQLFDKVSSIQMLHSLAIFSFARDRRGVDVGVGT